MNTEQERADFEAACRGHVDEAGYDEEALNLTRDGDGYIDKATQAAWWGWREGRAALQSQDRDEGYRAMAAEYQRWIDAYHQGMDYEDFLKKEARRIEGYDHG